MQCTALHCTALRPVGRHDLVHLDLKPSNIFIDSAARLKIGDFGCVNAPATGYWPLLLRTYGRAAGRSSETAP